MTDLKRNLENKIHKLLTLFPVVMLIGARQTGKTTLSKHIQPKWQYFDLENGSDYDFITQDYDFFSKNALVMSSLMKPRRLLICSDICAASSMPGVRN